jgi:hypothetical protein
MSCLDHGVCPTCARQCGCSFSPTSMSDYCSTHRPGKSQSFRRSPERDPRVNPLTGDEIFRNIKAAKGGGIWRKALRTHGGFIAFEQDNGYVRKLRRVSISDWRYWARKAEVTCREGVEI